MDFKYKMLDLLNEKAQHYFGIEKIEDLPQDFIDKIENKLQFLLKFSTDLIKEHRDKLNSGGAIGLMIDNFFDTLSKEEPKNVPKKGTSNVPNSDLPIYIELHNLEQELKNMLSTLTSGGIFAFLQVFNKFLSVYYAADAAAIATKAEDSTDKTQAIEKYINTLQSMCNTLDPSKPDSRVDFSEELAKNIDKTVTLNILVRGSGVDDYGNVYHLVHEYREKDSANPTIHQVDAAGIKAIITALQSEKDKCSQMNTQYTTQIRKMEGLQMML